MKRLAAGALSLMALFATASFALAYQSPGKPTGLVNDFAGILSAEQKGALEAKLGNYARPAGVQIAVVTVPTLGGETVENYAVKLFEEWGIGQKLKDNGLLLLVAPNERELRIEVGYGLEPSVTDARASSIIRNVITPEFKKGDYYGGIDKGLDAVMGLIDQDPETVQAVEAADQRPSGFPVSLPLVFGVFVIGLNLLGAMARSKSWWLGGVLGFIVGFIFASLIGAVVCAVVGFALDFVLSRFGGTWFNGPRGPRGPGFWFLGGGGRGGSGGGGFGGFGGGSSGGGGASGGW